MSFQLKWMLSLLTVLILLPVLPTLAQSPLPNRGNSPENQPNNNGDNDRGNSEPVGAFIELQVLPPHPGAWVEVEWQDETGNWHKVGGWRTQLDESGLIRWWVAPKDFGKGPFRWQMGDKATPSFFLPTLPNQVVRLELTWF